MPQPLGLNDLAVFSTTTTTTTTTVTLSPIALAPSPQTSNNAIHSNTAFILTATTPHIYDDTVDMRLSLDGVEPRPYPPPLALYLAARKVDDSAGVIHPDSNINPPAPAPSSDSSRAHSSSNGNTAVMPAIVAVALLVVCTLLMMRLLSCYNSRYRITPSYRPVVVGSSEPEKPRMWEVSLADAHPPTAAGKWCDLMPVTVECLDDMSDETSCSSRSSSRASRGSAAKATFFSSNSSRSSSPDSRVSSTRSSFEKFSTGTGVRVAVLVAMPSPHRHPERYSTTPSPSCLGLADV
ncbi:hypothetical protein C8Q80DRAFT_251879 [Daedaleopsis nitida]|nr:hypothetical protein C8Q80DRAFT_251879 [Daedaleopsis nitida]